MQQSKSTSLQVSSLVGWTICIIGALFYCYEYLLRIEPSVMVSELMQQFKIHATSFGLVTALYYYAYTPMQLVIGILLDKYGTRIILGLAVIICALGSFLFSVAHSVYVAAFARFLIGFGSSFAFVGVLKLAAEWLPKRFFAMFAGLATSLGMIGGMTGAIGLTSLVHTVGWRGTLHFGTIIGVVLIPIIFLFVHDSPAKKAGLKSKYSHPLKKMLLGLKQIIKTPQMWLCGITGSTLYLSLSAFAELWGIKFLQNVYNLPAKQAALASSMVFVGWLIGGPINGYLSDHIKSRKIPLIVGGILAAISIAIVILKPFHLSFDLICLLLFIFGAASSVENICFAVSRETNKPYLAATSVAFTNLIIMMSGIIFQPLLGVLLDLGWKGQMAAGIRIYSATNYQYAFLIIPVCVILGVIVTSRLHETLAAKG